VTLSIVARSADRSLFGVAIASSSPAVAARCAHARSGAGAVATQNITDPVLGPRMLDALDTGAGAAAAIAAALASTPFGAYRQLLAIGIHDAPAVHSGEEALGCVASAVGADAAAAGNLLANAGVPAAMLAAFAASAPGLHLGERLLGALRAGAAAGGEAGPLRSAGLLVVREVSWPIVDLRIDWDERDPLAALTAAWTVFAPQIDDYVRRALAPGAAPSFGVPGDP
jgi:uncharacterized Ntn-hydrolase superfamily protein